MLTNIEAVIFDLDGTLVDSMWLWETLDIEYLNKFGHTLPETLQKEIEGMSFTETALFFKEKFNIPDDVEDIKKEWNDMAEVYYRERVFLKENAEDFLRYLQGRGMKLGIGTSNSKELVQTVLTKQRVEKYFQSIRTGCEVERGKPHPDVYLKVAEDLKVDPENCLVFEDVIMGVKAGKRAGMKVCAIYDDFSKMQMKEIKSLADYYIHSYHELMGLLEGNSDETIFAN